MSLVFLCIALWLVVHCRYVLSLWCPVYISNNRERFAQWLTVLCVKWQYKSINFQPYLMLLLHKIQWHCRHSCRSSVVSSPAVPSFCAVIFPWGFLGVAWLPEYHSTCPTFWSFKLDQIITQTIKIRFCLWPTGPRVFRVRRTWNNNWKSVQIYWVLTLYRIPFKVIRIPDNTDLVSWCALNGWGYNTHTHNSIIIILIFPEIQYKINKSLLCRRYRRFMTGFGRGHRW